MSTIPNISYTNANQKKKKKKVDNYRLSTKASISDKTLLKSDTILS